jgi:hypothetical protein
VNGQMPLRFFACTVALSTLGLMHLAQTSPSSSLPSDRQEESRRKPEQPSHSFQTSPELPKANEPHEALERQGPTISTRSIAPPPRRDAEPGPGAVIAPAPR